MFASRGPREKRPPVNLSTRHIYEVLLEKDNFSRGDGSLKPLKLRAAASEPPVMHRP